MSDLSAQEIIAALHRLKHWQDLDEFEKQMLHQAAEMIVKLKAKVEGLETKLNVDLIHCGVLTNKNKELQAQLEASEAKLARVESLAENATRMWTAAAKSIPQSAYELEQDIFVALKVVTADSILAAIKGEEQKL